MAEILWPIAKNKQGEYIPIAEASEGGEYFCPECSSRMTARLGQIRQHHFGHYPGTSACCGESGYHFLAKHMLAFYLGENPIIEYRTKCPHCLKIISSTKEIVDVQVERGIDDYRPDLTIRLKNGYMAYGEIVYRHPLGDKLERYKSEHSDVLFWFIDGQVNEVPDIQLWTWQYFRVDPLPEGHLFFVSDLNPAPHVCAIEPGSEAEKAQKKKRDRASIQQVLKSKMGNPSRYRLNLWYEGRYGERLYSKTRSQLWAIGRKLLASSFSQSKRKPYLFILRVPYGSLFVDLGGTDTIRPWEEPGMVYGQLSCDDATQRFIIDTVREVLMQRGVETRLSFHDEYEPGGLFFSSLAEEEIDEMQPLR